MIIERIETDRLVIRNFTPDDANDLYEILGDAETMKHCEPAYDLKKTKDFLHGFCISKNGAVAAVHKQSQKVIGYILCNEIDPGVYEMGWFLTGVIGSKGTQPKPAKPCSIMRSVICMPIKFLQNHRCREIGWAYAKARYAV